MRRRAGRVALGSVGSGDGRDGRRADGEAAPALLELAGSEGLQVAQVHAMLREAVLNGEIPAGAERTQVALAQDLGVWRTPLREALRMLQREGLIASELGRRVQIAPLSSDDAEDLYVMRLSLETVALRLSVPALTSQAGAELEGLMAQMSHFQRVGDRRGMRPAHRAFHLGLVAGSGARGVVAIGELFDHAERYRLAFGAVTDSRFEERQAEHRELLDAVLDRDADRAVTALARHYVQTLRRVFEALDPEHDLDRIRRTLAVVAPSAVDTLG